MGRMAFKVWVYYALPELAANYGKPLPNRPSPPLLAYKGGKGCRFFKEAIIRQDFYVEDPAAENIIKVMCNANPKWKWTMNCWEVAGTNPWVNPVNLVKEEDSGRPWKKARIEALKEARCGNRNSHCRFP
ncbi:hypothetical protein DY000_02052286 [Brassica cretica]|uniref:Uncharacterized protein n=1 Tax=Brassica cretica TaxID=69181 RepID=A0ABQ7AJ10_BRACR|nr:hypothetical protein DY000_02052286 [Brassica cretica]